MNTRSDKKELQNRIAKHIHGYASGLTIDDPLKVIFEHVATRLNNTEPNAFSYMKMLDELNHLHVSVKSGLGLFSSMKQQKLKDYLISANRPIYTNIHSNHLLTIRPDDNDHYINALRVGMTKENKDHLKVLDYLYTHLYELANIKWIHTYSKNDQGQIMNQSIGDWQDSMMRQYESDSFDDFRRDFTIDGVKGFHGKKEELIIQDLRALIGRASTYPVDNNNEASKLLLDWMIKGTGGQANLNVIGHLFTNREYSNEIYGFLDSKALYNDWKIKDGRLSLEFAIQYFTLISEDGGILCKLPTGDEVIVFDTDAKLAGEETFESLNAKNGLFPLFTAKGTIALEYDAKSQNKITPVVLDLQVSSHSVKLLEPKPQQSHRLSK